MLEQDYIAAQTSFNFEIEETQPKQKRKYNMKKKQTPMIIITTINETLNKLKVTGCAFKVLLPNGEMVIHDPHEVLNKRKHNADPNRPYGYGDLCKRYKPVIEHMAVGEVQSVPFDDLHPADSLQSSMTAWMSTNWGKGSYTTVTNKDAQTIEVLRLK